MKISRYATGEYSFTQGFIEDDIFDTYKEALGGAAQIFEDDPGRDAVCIAFIVSRNKEGEIVKTKHIATVSKYEDDPQIEDK